MHFLPRQLKRHSFSCCVSSKEGTFVCRRCGGCPLIIGDQFVKYAPTGTRYGRSKKIHKQSVGHPWPFLLCSPLSFPNRLALSPRVRKIVRKMGECCEALRSSFKQGQECCDCAKTENGRKVSWEVQRPQSQEPVPSNMAGSGRVHYERNRRGAGGQTIPSWVAAQHQARISTREKYYWFACEVFW